MLKIGERIKSLRRERDITQDKLAAYLNISYQAVSKWENGTALPDITLIPGIANFFGVSADELLGMKEREGTEQLKEYEKIYHENRRLGKMFDNTILSREVLSKYPRNFQWMLNLAYSLVQYNDTEEHYNYSAEHDFRGEAINLCERVLEDCTIDSIRHSAIQILCYEYPKVGKKDLALKLAQEMPDIYVCRESLLAHIYEGEEQIKAIQDELMQMIELCAGSIWMLASYDLMGKELSATQKIELIETANSLYFTILNNDEDVWFYNSSLCRNYMKLSQLWCGLGNTEKGMENLLLAEKSAKRFDRWEELSEQNTYKSLLVNRHSVNPKHVGKSLEGTETHLLLRNLENKIFDTLRETEEFEKLIDRLK